MSFADIEAELEKMPPDQLRSLALKSWAAYVKKEGSATALNVCDENDPLILAALDRATQRADGSSNARYSGDQVRSRLNEWISK
jgi:hypothetical protein